MAEGKCEKVEGKCEKAKRFVEKAEGKPDSTQRNTVKTPLTSIIRQR
jgi:hypothetical protein